ncbi:VOC family protein [Herbiconiux ginsengi]|uniref:VOC family protein n=1 Tax=Herbiconiux ginsengi TaxID=381665 RepID=UPI001114896D|nr:VOC family protein [Herbiconiux ginsengi]
MDLETSKPAATREFYEKLFGWTVTDPDSRGYRLASLDGCLVAGLGVSRRPDRPFWSTNLLSTDLAGSVAACVERGGEVVVEPMSSGPLGDFAMIRDPVGARIGFWHPRQPSGMQIDDNPGTFVGITMVTQNPSSAIDFSVRALGWTAREAGAGGRELDLPLRARARVYRGALTREDPNWIVEFGSRDVQSDVHLAESLGAVRLPSCPPGVSIMRDPQGALFGLRMVGQQHGRGVAGTPWVAKT